MWRRRNVYRVRRARRAGLAALVALSCITGGCEPTLDLHITSVEVSPIVTREGHDVEIMIEGVPVGAWPRPAPPSMIMVRCAISGEDVRPSIAAPLFDESLDGATPERGLRQKVTPFQQRALPSPATQCDIAVEFRPSPTLRRYCWSKGEEVREGACAAES